jgi:hypothetical protein
MKKQEIQPGDMVKVNRWRRWPWGRARAGLARIPEEGLLALVMEGARNGYESYVLYIFDTDARKLYKGCRWEPEYFEKLA